MPRIKKCCRRGWFTFFRKPNHRLAGDLLPIQPTTGRSRPRPLSGRDPMIDGNNAVALDKRGAGVDLLLRVGVDGQRQVPPVIKSALTAWPNAAVGPPAGTPGKTNASGPPKNTTRWGRSEFPQDSRSDRRGACGSVSFWQARFQHPVQQGIGAVIPPPALPGRADLNCRHFEVKSGAALDCVPPQTAAVAVTRIKTMTRTIARRRVVASSSWARHLS